ncbi:ecdysteroid-regulated 16 kDa protein-like [Phymastichus coffea]|uniref:ecdysteroid-regulated 16 kDa protein-like n=1 Tax=Phymastichus coffea TaxID=108790 RepID=UPI00273C73B7|nr:ecdysteroid-regulated 16 kDa protein-like [Phymastichus coffea]
MKSILQVIAVVVMIILDSNGTKINKCQGDNAPSINDLKVMLGNCTDEVPCVLTAGETYNFEQKFKAPKDVDDLQSNAFGLVFTYLISIKSASDPEACKKIENTKGMTGVCPLKKGENYIYKNAIKIKENEIRASINVQWHLTHANESLTCFEIPIKIQDK